MSNTKDSILEYVQDALMKRCQNKDISYDEYSKAMDVIDHERVTIDQTWSLYRRLCLGHNTNFIPYSIDVCHGDIYMQTPGDKKSMLVVMIPDGSCHS